MLLRFKPIAAFLALSFTASAQDLPLLQVEDLVYTGAFRVSASEYGSSNMNYSIGTIAYNEQNHSLFMAGHAHHSAIAEFPIPDLVQSTTLADLNMSESPVQPFRSILSEMPDGNPQLLGQITGMMMVGEAEQAQLVVNAVEYYDAAANNTHTTLAVRDPGELGSSDLAGFFELEGSARAAGWISPIPAEWQSALGGTHITGHSSGLPIIGRLSVGPSAFILNPQDIVSGDPDQVETTAVLEFSLENRLHPDLSNESGENKIWTHLTRASYGFIVPGTSTYLTIGYSGGHEAGVCYKCTQDNGNLCGGYCSPDSNDYYQFAWLWDVKDMVAVKNGQMQPHEVRPYWSGKFATPFENSHHQINGGAYDPGSGLLYLSIARADNEQGTYANPPVIVTYALGNVSLPIAFVDVDATVIGRDVRLNWSVSGADVDHVFDIEHRRGSAAWSRIGTVDGVLGESVDHSWMAKDMDAGHHAFRIKQFDPEGTFRYSAEVEVEVVGEYGVVVGPAPNPFSTDIRLSLNIESAQSVGVQVFDLTGRLVLESSLGQSPAGRMQIELDGSGLPAGMYLIKVKGERFEHTTVGVRAH